MKQRIRQYILDNYGQDILDQVLSRKRTVTLNGKELIVDAHFKDKRVTETSTVVICLNLKDVFNNICTEPKAEVPVAKEPEEEEETEITEPPVKKHTVRDFVTTKQVLSIKSGRSNIFLDGMVTTLETEIDMNESAEPVKDGIIVTIKVLPKFTGGSSETKNEDMVFAALNRSHSSSEFSVDMLKALESVMMKNLSMYRDYEPNTIRILPEELAKLFNVDKNSEKFKWESLQDFLNERGIYITGEGKRIKLYFKS